VDLRIWKKGNTYQSEGHRHPFWLAWVEDKLPTVIYVNPISFFTRAPFGRNSQSGILLHETTHNLWATDDYRQTPLGCKLLAAEKPPIRAFDNANNYEYFAEDNE
jgi:hypothetical protein